MYTVRPAGLRPTSLTQTGAASRRVVPAARLLPLRA
jgi:hypothetical protein